MDPLTIEIQLMQDKERQNALFRLSGLTLERYRLLHLASMGRLPKINPATHQAMRALIGADLRCTDAGYKLLQLVINIAEEVWYVGPRDCIQPDDKYQKYVKFLRRWRDGRLYSAHMKALLSIYNDGSLSEAFLAHVYGSRIVGELWRYAWTEICTLPDIAGWHIYRLSALGDSLLQDLVLLQEGKSLQWHA